MAQIALTTTFQPPASCFDDVYTSLGGGVYEKDVSIASSECYPSAFHSLFTESIPYSPGVCPESYSYDSTTSYSGGATAALCCPLGMTAYDSGLGCNSQVSDGTELFVDGGTITVDQAVLAVHGVYIAWRSDGQPPSGFVVTTSSSSKTSSSSSSFAPAPASSTTIVTSTSARTTSSTSVTSTLIPPTNLQPSVSASTVTITASHTSTNPSPPPQSLSTGAKAGIGVGASIGGLGVIGLAAWFLLSRKKKHSEEDHSDSQLPMYDEKRQGVADTRSPHISELSSETRRSELLGGLPWMEVQSKNGRAELEGRSDLEMWD